MTPEEILKGESKNVEFKRERPQDSTKYMKTIIAFSNGDGGVLVFGVDDKTRKIVGIPQEKVFSEMDAITAAIADSCEPTVVPDVYLQTVDDKTIIMAEISAGRQRPYYLKSKGIKEGTYIRVAGTSRPAGRDLTAEMYYEDEGRSYDKVIRKDRTVSEKEIQDLCRQMKEVALSNSHSETQKESIKDITKNVLLSWGLLAEDEEGIIHPTNGYIFLTGQDDFLSYIQCGMFKGNTRAIFVDKREYTGPLWKQIEDAFQFVLRNIRLGAKLSGVYRQDIYELPPDSIRELIINAVMNCSFLQPSHIQVAVYDNRLEITSPGGLLPGVTVDRIREGYSKIRNKALARAFAYMNLIEAWGSGIPKLIQAMEDYGLPAPEFIDGEIYFRVNLYRKNLVAEETNQGDNKTTKINEETNQAYTITNQGSKMSNQGGEKTNQAHKNTNQVSAATKPNQNLNAILNSVSDIDKKLLLKIHETPSISQRELATATQLKTSTVKYYVLKLRKQGILSRKGSSQKGHWVIHTAGEANQCKNQKS